MRVDIGHASIEGGCKNKGDITFELAPTDHCRFWHGGSVRQSPPTREGSRRFAAVEPLRTSVQVSYTPCSRCKHTRRFGSVEPHRIHVKDLYTPCFLCNEVVGEGSRRFAAVEPLRMSV